MFDWLFEGALTVYVILAIPAVILLTLWYRDRKRHWLFGVGVIGLLLLAYFLLDQFVETQYEQVDRKLKAMATAVKHKDSEAIFAHISDRFQVGPLNKTNFRRGVEAVMKIDGVNDLAVWDVKRPDERGIARFLAKPKGSMAGDKPYYLVRGEFVRDDDGQWRLKSFEVANPYSDSEAPLEWWRYLPGER